MIGDKMSSAFRAQEIFKRLNGSYEGQQMLYFLWLGLLQSRGCFLRYYTEYHTDNKRIPDACVISLQYKKSMDCVFCVGCADAQTRLLLEMGVLRLKELLPKDLKLHCRNMEIEIVSQEKAESTEELYSWYSEDQKNILHGDIFDSVYVVWRVSVFARLLLAIEPFL